MDISSGDPFKLKFEPFKATIYYSRLNEIELILSVKGVWKYVYSAGSTQAIASDETESYLELM